MHRAVTVLCLGLIAGCGKAPPHTKSMVELKQVPANIMKTARTKQPQLVFNSAIKRADGIYEVRGKNKAGKLVVVEINEAGQFIKLD